MSVRMAYRKKTLPATDILLAEARRIYGYDPSGGLVLVAHANPRHPGRGVIGSAVGGDDGHGYLMCMLLGHKFKVHQIVWLICTGQLAYTPLDHINGNRLDNRITNLRAATDEQNGSNRRREGAVPGVHLQRGGRGVRYEASIGHKGQKIALGGYATKEEAEAAYIAASRKLRGDFSPI